MKDLRNIAKKLGGETFYDGTQANVPAPRHSSSDRSVSIGLSADGRVIINTYSTKHLVTWQEVRDDLLARGLIDLEGRPCNGGQPRFFGERKPAPTDRQRAARAQELWDLAVPTPGTASERWAIHRGITTPIGPHVARHLAETPISCFDSGKTRTMPAQLVAIHNQAGQLSAIEITYLTALGRRTSNLTLSRKTIGLMGPSSAVRIDPVDREMLVGEGFWTTKSARQKFSLPSWALTCTRNMRSFVPPAEVEVLHIAQDNGADGERSALILAHRCREMGKRAIIHAPPARYDDFNSWHTASLRLVQIHRAA
jgi:putative DNA primase/helicase